MGAAWLLRNSIFTVRVSQGYLVPKEHIPQKRAPRADTEPKDDKPVIRRARDMT
jgi:hypothetical protein